MCFSQSRMESTKTPSLTLFSIFHSSPTLSSLPCSPPSLQGHWTPWQFVLNLTVQMFLWVTGFYSLEKIISAFPQIVLLYLKIAWSKKGGGVGGLCCLGSESRVAHLLLMASDGRQGVSRVALNFHMYSSSLLRWISELIHQFTTPSAATSNVSLWKYAG